MEGRWLNKDEEEVVEKKGFVELEREKGGGMTDGRKGKEGKVLNEEPFVFSWFVLFCCLCSLGRELYVLSKNEKGLLKVSLDLEGMEEDEDDEDESLFLRWLEDS